MEWLKNQVQITPPKKPKKLTGTRFATILGLNPWSTPFEIWCEVTRTYQKPFEDTKYTIAGKVIEPKQAAFMRSQYFMDITAPADVWGEDYFKKTFGDFFPDYKVTGGMWDYLLGAYEHPQAVLEMKTTKRAEDWSGNKIPEYYALQAALYAYMLGVDTVIMVASFLEEADYEHPENYVCDIDNTITRTFKVSERYPTFEDDYIKPALRWWEDYVVSGISPYFDEKKDAEILKALRTNNLTPDTDIVALIDEAEKLKAEIDSHAKQIADTEKRYKKICEMVKQAAMERFREGDNKVAIAGSHIAFEITKSTKTSIDKDALRNDGLLDKYTVSDVSYRLTTTELKG